MIDLHTHSTASDGTFSPSQLIDYAHKQNLQAIALTDHDSVNGISEAQEEAKKLGIIFIPGIEISIDWPTGEFHLLGLGLKSLSPELKKIIKFLEEERCERNKKMATKLQDCGININYEELVDFYHTENIGRPHFAAMMFKKGLVKQRQQAFDLYFAKGRPCYVERKGADLEESVKAIKASGGIPIQAHPMSMYVSWGKMDATMEEVISKGVEGLEAYHPGVRYSEARRLEELGKKMNIIVTAGSDFHGEKIRADRKIGYTAGKIKIEDKYFFENLKPVLDKLHPDYWFES